MRTPSAGIGREGQLELVERYLDALVASEPFRLRLGSDVRFTENGQVLPLGKGLWATATADPAPRPVAYVCDPEAGQVGCFAVVSEAGRAVMLALRLKEQGGVVVEIETLVCRGGPALRIFDPAGLQARPELDEVLAEADRGRREELIAGAGLYFQGLLQGRGEVIPIIPEALRIENGVSTVHNPDFGSPLFAMGIAEAVDTGIYVRVIESVRQPRFLAVDVERGLVYVVFTFDHPGPVRGAGEDATFGVPNSMMGAEIFKIKGGLIRHIEAILSTFPYGMPSGW
ncbi:MAG: hypothetical protein ACRDY1_16415 [Acidimicrobiales bacterium]